jgi:hypothetical protein
MRYAIVEQWGRIVRGYARLSSNSMISEGPKVVKPKWQNMAIFRGFFWFGMLEGLFHRGSAEIGGEIFRTLPL